MVKMMKKSNFWLRRRSTLPFVIVGSVIVLVLFLNEETSVKTNVEYEKRINMLKSEIKENQDSAAWYRQHRMAIEKGESDLEHLAREKYHMQRPTEDIYIYSEE